ncbi:hypothetical protein [Tsuneonella sp. HG222]
MNRSTLTLFAMAGLLAGCGGGEADKPSVKAFMANEVQKTAETYWNAVQFISDETGEHDIRPETDEEWQKVVAAADKLAAHGQTLKEPGYAEGRGQGWIEFSDGLIEVAGKAREAAVSKDPDAVFEVGGTVYSVCSACHQAYPPADGEPGAASPA